MSTIIELKPYLNFNIIPTQKKSFEDVKNKFDGLICYDQDLDQILLENLKKIDCFKILATNKAEIKYKLFDYILKLPTSVKDMNEIIEISAVKKEFNKNSSIEIKNYLLDKNEKKLFKGDNFIILTEKEIQLLDLFLTKKKEISKTDILSEVWHYSSDADTHTVETHIYRLRKKISDKFSDSEFILNNKVGYYL